MVPLHAPSFFLPPFLSSSSFVLQPWCSLCCFSLFFPFFLSLWVFSCPFPNTFSQRCHHVGCQAQWCPAVGPLEPGGTSWQQLCLAQSSPMPLSTEATPAAHPAAHAWAPAPNALLYSAKWRCVVKFVLVCLNGWVAFFSGTIMLKK